MYIVSGTAQKTSYFNRFIRLFNAVYKEGEIIYFLSDGATAITDF
jgi:hypothetical protein